MGTSNSTINSKRSKMTSMKISFLAQFPRQPTPTPSLATCLLHQPLTQCSALHTFTNPVRLLYQPLAQSSHFFLTHNIFLHSSHNFFFPPQPLNAHGYITPNLPNYFSSVIFQAIILLHNNLYNSNEVQKTNFHLPTREETLLIFLIVFININ